MWQALLGSAMSLGADDGAPATSGSSASGSSSASAPFVNYAPILFGGSKAGDAETGASTSSAPSSASQATDTSPSRALQPGINPQPDAAGLYGMPPLFNSGNSIYVYIGLAGMALLGALFILTRK